MKASEVRALLQLRRREGDPTRRRLANCLSIGDLQRQARRSLPRPVYDYVEGGAENERTILSNVDAFASVTFEPRILRGVGAVNLQTTILDEALAVPIVLAPTGLTRMVHPDGELAVGRAAHLAGIPYVLSTYGTTSMEAVAKVVPERFWFQLYPFKDAGATADLMDRAWASGCSTLVLTVDTTVVASRTRDRRNGFSIPPRLSPRTVLQMASKPRWCLGMLMSETMMFQNLPVPPDCGTTEIFEYAARNFHDSLSWNDVERVRGRWPGRLCVKGVVRADDVAHAAARGVDAVILSNHGGRQLDGAVSPLRQVAEARDRVGNSLALIVDSGVRHGSDVAAAIALGADACAIGRGYLYGLAVAGEAGVAHAIGLLADELRRTLGMLGVRDIGELKQSGPDLVRIH